MSIDYGHGRINIDLETGIRFGVISQSSILQAWADSSEGDYGAPRCPDCGSEFPDAQDIEDCGVCGAPMDDWSDGVEALNYSFEGDGYKMTSCLDSDVMVFKSPFYTYAPFCSPCVPGAGNLDSAAQAGGFSPFESDIQEFAESIGAQIGVKTYAVGHDWFEDGVAPYPLYGVVSGRPCFPDSWYGL